MSMTGLFCEPGLTELLCAAGSGSLAPEAAESLPETAFRSSPVLTGGPATNQLTITPAPHGAVRYFNHRRRFNI